jgi:uncharacterized membrane protein YoaK (UPF0700 family)
VFKATSGRPLIRATLLTIVAGLADAIGYITMGGVFAANMTGNTVLAGIAAAGRDFIQAWHHLTPLIAFFVGAMLARLLLRLLRTSTVAIALEAVLIAGAGFLDVGPQPAVLIVAAAMGLQASAITHFAGNAVSTVVVTSTLARTADSALDRLWRGQKTDLPVVSNAQLLILTWTGYLAGAIAGALLIPAVAYPLLVPAGLLLVILAL